MKREIDIKEISDGKLYTANDMVKTDCRDCIGCSDCCKGMGNSIVLDPMDVWRLTYNLHTDFNSLLEKNIELGMVDGLILPNLKLTGEAQVCSFLSEEGRCKIHSFRPGICRLFPLGRIYEEDHFRYFLQIHECPKKDKTKIKIKKWLGISDIRSYEEYIIAWHSFINCCEESLKELTSEQRKTFTLYLLKTFFQTTYETADFYEDFYERLKKAKEMFGFDSEKEKP